MYTVLTLFRGPPFSGRSPFSGRVCPSEKSAKRRTEGFRDNQ